ASYELLTKAETVAIFQLAARGMPGLLKDARPDRFEDIIALVALYRPGPVATDSGLLQAQARRKIRLSRSAHRSHSRRALRHHGLPGAGDAEGADRRRLLAGRRRHAAPRDGQEEGRRDGRAPRDLP